MDTSNNNPLMISMEARANLGTAPNFYSPQKQSESLASSPEVVEVDTPDSSLMLSSYVMEENVSDVDVDFDVLMLSLIHI